MVGGFGVIIYNIYYGPDSPFFKMQLLNRITD